MPVICWGGLGLSTDDGTTIAEYISAQILNHNVNPSSHGLDGQAVYSHRSQVNLDHLDYSVTSDKITTNQIVAKDFRTALNVGPSVDGIKFDKNAIEMWQNAERRVYIPKSGQPEIIGTIRVNAIQYINYYFHCNNFSSVAMPFGCTVSQYYMDMAEIIGPDSGVATFALQMPVAGAGTGRGFVWEMNLGNVGGRNRVEYYGTGQEYEVLDVNWFRFAFMYNKSTWTFLGRYDDDYSHTYYLRKELYKINNYPTWNKLRVEQDNDRGITRVIVNNYCYATINLNSYDLVLGEHHLAQVRCGSTRYSYSELFYIFYFDISDAVF